MSPCNFHLAQLTELHSYIYPMNTVVRKFINIAYYRCIFLYGLLKEDDAKSFGSLDEFFEVMCKFDRLLINKKISVDNICGWGFIWPNECLLAVMFGIQSREKNRQ